MWATLNKPQRIGDQVVNLGLLGLVMEKKDLTKLNFGLCIACMKAQDRTVGIS